MSQKQSFCIWQPYSSMNSGCFHKNSCFSVLGLLKRFIDKLNIQYLSMKLLTFHEFTLKEKIQVLGRRRNYFCESNYQNSIFVNKTFHKKIIQSTIYICVFFQLILNKLFLLDIPCPLCIESRSALLQICSGLLLPLIATPVANFSVSDYTFVHDINCHSFNLFITPLIILVYSQVSAGTAAYSVPHITDGRKIFSTILSAYQPMFPKIVMIFTFHALLAGFITYLEIKSFMRIIDIQYIMKEEKKSKNLNKTT